MKVKLPLFLGMLLTANLSASLAPTNLSCEGWRDPLGVDLPQPKLGWTVESSERGARQTAYQIEVVTPEGKKLWDSGKVDSRETTGLPYAGQPLASSQLVRWKVRVWDEQGHVSAWSTPTTWTMGVLTQGEWGRANWIGAPDGVLPTIDGPKAHYETVLLRHEFKVGPGLRRAVVHVAGLGQYEMRLNGAKVGQDLFTPGWTKYDRTSLYDTYDVTSSLKPGGANAVGLFLDNGMYVSHKGRYIKEAWAFGPLQAIALLRLEYQDGRVETVVTDAGWRALSGPITFSSPYGGEDYDARLSPAGWDQPGFDDAKWESIRVTQGPGGKLAGLRFAAPPVREIEALKPVSQKEFGPAVTVYDFGQNASVIPRLSMRGPVGSSIKIVPAELVKPDGGIDDTTCGGGSIWTYTLAGDGQEKWTPAFFYRGARYMQVERRPAQEGGPLPELDSLEAVVVHSSARPVGEFSCSNDLFNRIYTLVRWAQRSNLMSVLTDCPQREKLGWIEQNHLNGPSLRYAFDLNALFAKGVNDMADSQLSSGLVPNIAPEYVAFGGEKRNSFGDSPEWSSSFLVVPWQQYEFTGDTGLLALRYEEMKKYIAYLDTRAQGDILDYGLGDWFDIGPKKPGKAQLTPKALTATAYYFYNHRIIAQAAKILGHPADAEKYAKRAEEIRGAFNRRFFDPKANQYATGSQCANAMPLVLEIVEPQYRGAVLQNIVADVQSKGLTAGDVGYRYLLRALADGGRSDVVFALNNQSEKPGYGYQLKHGATSLLEAWDANRRDSQNHFMLGQINEWFFHDLAGIQPDIAGPGFAKFVIKPAIVGGDELTWVKAGYDSARGRIVSEWKREGDRLTLRVTVPANTTATIHVPARDVASVREGNGPATSAPDVKFLRMEDAAAVFSVESGAYVFVSQLPTASHAAITTTPASVPNSSSVGSSDELKKAKEQLLSYFGTAAPQLLRPAQGVLSHPSIACSLPGAAYHTNLWDWDTYWTMRGLFRYAAISKDAAFRQQVGEHAIGSFQIFFEHQSEEGRIPMVMDVKSPDGLGAMKKDRPKGQNQAKPVFAQMALLISNEVGSVEWLAPQFDKLLRFYDSWVTGNQSSTGLFVWGNDVAIGNDNDPTTFGRPDFSSANLLLNCLYYEDLKAAAELAGRLKRPEDQARLSDQARTLGERIQKYCWDPRDQFYYTVDVQCVDRRKELIPRVKPGMNTSWQCLPLRIQTFTGFLPLWCGLATPEQAKALVATNYRADDRLRANFGVRTLSNKETMYSLEYSKANPSNWLGPVWIVANYFTWKGLKDSGFTTEANELADKTIRMLADDLAKNGSLNEYYNPDTGTAISHKGFMNWNLLVMEMM